MQVFYFTNSIYYAYFEATELPFIDPKTDLLMRLVDDFMLITPNYSTASKFYEVMAQGSIK